MAHKNKYTCWSSIFPFGVFFCQAVMYEEFNKKKTKLPPRTNLNNNSYILESTLFKPAEGSNKKPQPFFMDFSRPFRGPHEIFEEQPARNVISMIVQKCTFPVQSNRTLRLELFAPPTSLHFAVHLS